MNARGERFLERLEQVFGQLREGVDLLQAQPLRGCSPAMLTALQQVGLSSRFIYEAAYVDGDVVCSNRGDERAFEPLRAPDIRGPTYSYWLNTTTEPNENLAALMLGRGKFVVSTSRGHLTDVVDLPPGGSWWWCWTTAPGLSPYWARRRYGRRPRHGRPATSHCSNSATA